MVTIHKNSLMNSALALSTSLLFTDNTKVDIPFVEFAKATPVTTKICKVDKSSVGFNLDSV